MTWLRERKVLLPGVTTLTRLVARVRDDTTNRLLRVLEALLTSAQRRMLDRLLEVPPGLRVSDLERWRKEPPPRGSGPAIIAALDQVAEIQALGLAGLGAEAAVPPRRLGELARYGIIADAWLIRRHPDGRRLATLLATVRHLEARSVDDANSSPMPRPSRLCSCTIKVTAGPAARISRARDTARSSSGRVTARGEIFSAKVRGTPAARRESSWVSSDWRTVEARAYPTRTCPAGTASAPGGRARLAHRGNRNAERLGQMRHEPEPGGVVLGGHPALAGPAWRSRRGRAGGRRAVVRLDAQEIIVAHPRSFHEGAPFTWPYATTCETHPAAGCPGMPRSEAGIMAGLRCRGQRAGGGRRSGRLGPDR